MTPTHRQRVDRDCAVECDGILWYGQEPWPDGRLLRDLFWTHYAPLIDERLHGRALRALIQATPHGMKAFANAREFREMLVATFTPFLRKKGEQRRPPDECAWCTRPGVELGQQCQGCGAWRRKP